MPTIACLSPYNEDLVKQLADTDDVTVVLAPDAPTPEQVASVVADADIVISDARHRTRLDRDAIGAMRRCRLIMQPAVGFDVVDHLAAAERGIPVCNAAGFNKESVADWVLLAMLDAVTHGSRSDQAMHAGAWRTSRRGRRELGAMTVGILGMGNIGQAVFRRLQGFGCRVLYSDVVRRDIPGAEQVDKTTLLQTCDIVTVHVPLDGGTRGIVGAEELRLMPQGAVLVNASRGPAVDEAALVEALRSGHLGGAALDVFEVEPLAEDSPLRGMDNVFLSPHIAGGTREAGRKALEMVAENIRRVLAGLEPVHVVNGVLPETAQAAPPVPQTEEPVR